MIPGCLIIKLTITQNVQYRNHFHNVLCLSEAKEMDIKMKNRIYIWGIGKGYKMLKSALYFDCIEMVGFLDNDEKLWGTEQENSIVYAPYNLLMEIDYILISTINYIDQIKNQLLTLGVSENKIIAYFDAYDCIINEVNFINYTVRIMQLMERKFQNVFYKMSNMEYEIADKVRKGCYQFPIIEPAENALNEIIEKSKSMCRFGDGEFEVLFQRPRSTFQKIDSTLAIRLKEVLVNKESCILTCIANNYGDLSCYTEEAALSIRAYMSQSIRESHMSVIDMSKTYYDAYVTRVYMMYRNKEHAVHIFELWKRIWHNRDIVMIEGRYTKNGYDNDLFANAASVKRVLCPTQNAWNKYREIYDWIISNVSKEKLILITLGQTATVLAFDLAMMGYQAIDMGQLDNEYEWYKRGATKKIPLSNKYVHEAGKIGQINSDVYDPLFEKQVIVRIGC